MPQKPSDEFRAGDTSISAEALNKILRATPRQFVGGGETNVQQFGDRVYIHSEADHGKLPDITNYVGWFVVLQEFDDYLACVPYFQDIINTGPFANIPDWSPYVYYLDRGSTRPDILAIAKPIELQRVPWHNIFVTIGGRVYRRQYTAVGSRDVLYADGTLFRSEQIDRQYIQGDIIRAERKVTGIIDQTGMGAYWIDTNDAARRWVEVEVDVPTPDDPDYCGLAKLKKTDCVKVTGPYGTVTLEYNELSDKWTSTDTLTYGAGEDFTGQLAFWFEKGEVHLSLTVTTIDPETEDEILTPYELLNCHDNCFKGGPLTGHIPEDPEDHGVCDGEVFQVCVECVDCDPSTVASPCCPDHLFHPRLWALVHGVGMCDSVYPLDYDGATGLWYSDRAPIGTCSPEIPTPGVGGHVRATLTFGCWGVPEAWSLGVYGYDPDVTEALVSFDCDVPHWAFSSVSGSGGMGTCSCPNPYLVEILDFDPSGGKYIALSAEADCGYGNCIGQPVTITGTITDKVGLFAAAPDTVVFTCHTSFPRRYWQQTTNFTAYGGTGPSYIIWNTSSTTGAWGAVPLWNFSNSLGAGVGKLAVHGYTCDPFSAVFYFDDNAGNSCTLTVVE